MEMLLAFGLTVIVGSFFGNFLQLFAKLANSVSGPKEIKQAEVVKVQAPDHQEPEASLPLVASDVATVTFNEGKCQLYFYRPEARVRVMFLPDAKFLKNRYGRRMHLCDLDIGDSDAAVKAKAVTKALEFIKAEIAEKIATKIAQKEPEASPALPAPAAPASTAAAVLPAADKQEPEQDFPYVIGVVESFGLAPFPYGNNGKESFFVEIRSKQKAFKLWGADLARCIDETAAKVGNRVKIVKKGKQPVMVATSRGEKEVLKNLFEMSVLR